MPSHIYFRVGRYLDALADNKVAVGVDEIDTLTKGRNPDAMTGLETWMP